MKKNREPGHRMMTKIKILLSFSRVIALVLLLALQPGVILAFGQNGTVNLSMQKATLQDVIWAVEKQTKFVFVYDAEDLNRAGQLNLNLKDKSV